jgi:hypothetical protein
MSESFKFCLSASRGYHAAFLIEQEIRDLAPAAIYDLNTQPWIALFFRPPSSSPPQRPHHHVFNPG